VHRPTRLITFKKDFELMKKKPCLIIFIVLLFISYIALAEQTQTKYQAFTGSPLLDTSASQESKEKVSKLILLLKNKDCTIRINAIHLLQQLNIREAIPSIIPLLKDNYNWGQYNWGQSKKLL
jgi:hypothetical protein